MKAYTRSPMAIELLLVLSSLVLTFIIYFSLKGKNGGKTLRLPPGSMGLPFIGETIAFMQPHSSSSLGSYMDQHIARYGRVFRTNLLAKPTIVSADPELNRYILQNEGRLFENSCPVSIQEIMGQWSMLALTGDVHKEMRSIAINFMSNAKLRAYFLPDIEQQALKVLNSWEDKRDGFSAQDECKKFAFSLTVKHLMGMDSGTPETEKLRTEYHAFMKGMASIPLNIPGTAYRRALQARSVILKIVGHKLDERIQKTQDGCTDHTEQGDLLSSVSRHPHLMKEQILDLILSMLFAGHETSSAAIALAIYFLQSCPKAVEQLREEHTKIAMKKELGGEVSLSWEDYKEMEFTHCVINETLRLGNIVKFLHRRAIKDVQFKGYEIPCGWEVVPIISAAHLDPSMYHDPQDFNPSRWQSNSAAIIKNNNIMSFSGGARMCPGSELAKLEIGVFLHYLIQKYNWELVENDYPMSFPFLGFTKGLPIKVTKI